MLDYLLNIAGSEWMIIIFVALVLILGTGKLPGAARKLGKAVNEYNKAKDEIKEHGIEPTEKQIAYFNEFKDNLMDGINYYRDLFPAMTKESKEYRNNLLKELSFFKEKLIKLMKKSLVHDGKQFFLLGRVFRKIFTSNQLESQIINKLMIHRIIPYRNFFIPSHNGFL